MIDKLIKSEANIKDYIENYKNIFPLLIDFKDTPQDNIWHAEGDVEMHTGMVIKEIYNLFKNNSFTDSEKRVLVLAALLHDICKPLTTKEKEINNQKRIVAPKHEKMGMDYLFYKLYDLDLSQDEILNVISLVGYHQIPKLLVVKNKEYSDYLKLSQSVNNKLIYNLEVADIKGRECPDKKEQLEILEIFKLFSKEYGFWNEFNNPIKEESIFLKNKGLKDLINKKIFTPEETKLKYYSSYQNYSHCIVFCGLSGIGKSEERKRFKGYNIISLDDIREEFGGVKNRKYEGQVRQEAKSRLKKYLKEKENIIFDATNIREDFRKQIIDTVDNYNGLSEILCFGDNIKNIVEKDKKRVNSVGEELIIKQEKRFQFPEVGESDISSYISKKENKKLKNRMKNKP